MRMACLVVLGGVALAACDREPTFDASSLPAYQKSLAEVTARLSPQEKHKLQLALLTLAAGQASDYTAFGLANPASVDSLETLDGITNPLVFLDRMRPQISGRTAASVIGHVADDLDYAISRAETMRKGADKTLAAFVIENATFSWDRNRSQQAAVEFSVYNGSKAPISGIYLNTVITARGHTTPIAFGRLQYHFVPPLQPGVQEQVKAYLGSPSKWTAQQLQDSYDLDCKLEVSNIQDDNGRPLFGVNADALDTMRRKRDALRGS
jgi:hypothetical protein